MTMIEKKVRTILCNIMPHVIVRISLYHIILCKTSNRKRMSLLNDMALLTPLTFSLDQVTQSFVEFLHKKCNVMCWYHLQNLKKHGVVLIFKVAG